MDDRGEKKEEERGEINFFFVATLGGSFSSLLIPRCVLNEPWHVSVSCHCHGN